MPESLSEADIAQIEQGVDALVGSARELISEFGTTNPSLPVMLLIETAMERPKGVLAPVLAVALLRLARLPQVRDALARLDGTPASAVALLTGLTTDQLDELGGVDERR